MRYRKEAIAFVKSIERVRDNTDCVYTILRSHFASRKLPLARFGGWLEWLQKAMRSSHSETTDVTVDPGNGTVSLTLLVNSGDQSIGRIACQGEIEGSYQSLAPCLARLKPKV